MPSALQTLTFTVIDRSCKTNSMWEAQIFGSVNIRIWEKGACGILIFHTQSGHCVDNSGCIDGIVIHDLAVSNEGTQRRLMSKEHLVVPSLFALFLFGESLIWAFRPPHSHSSLDSPSSLMFRCVMQHPLATSDKLINAAHTQQRMVLTCSWLHHWRTWWQGSVYSALPPVPLFKVILNPHHPTTSSYPLISSVAKGLQILVWSILTSGASTTLWGAGPTIPKPFRRGIS